MKIWLSLVAAYSVSGVRDLPLGADGQFDLNIPYVTHNHSPSSLGELDLNLPDSADSEAENAVQPFIPSSLDWPRDIISRSLLANSPSASSEIHPSSPYADSPFERSEAPRDSKRARQGYAQDHPILENQKEFRAKNRILELKPQGAGPVARIQPFPEAYLSEAQLPQAREFVLNYHVFIHGLRKGDQLQVNDQTISLISSLRQLAAQLIIIYDQSLVYSSGRLREPCQIRLMRALGRTYTDDIQAKNTSLADEIAYRVCWFREFLGDSARNSRYDEDWFKGLERDFRNKGWSGHNGNNHLSRRNGFATFYARKLGFEEIQEMDDDKKKQVNMAISKIKEWEVDTQAKIIAEQENEIGNRNVETSAIIVYYNPPIGWAEEVIPLFIYFTGILQKYLGSLVKPLATQIAQKRDIQWESWLYLQTILERLINLSPSATMHDFQECFKINNKGSMKVVRAIAKSMERSPEKSTWYRLSHKLLSLWLSERNPELRSVFLSSKTRHIRTTLVSFFARATMYEAAKKFVIKI